MQLFKPKYCPSTSQCLSQPVTLCSSSGGGGHEHAPVPAVLVLSCPAGSLSGLHGALLPVLKIHQTEVQSGLVNTSGSDQMQPEITHTTLGQGCIFVLIDFIVKCFVFFAALEGSNLGSSSTGSTLSHAFVLLFPLLGCFTVKWCLVYRKLLLSFILTLAPQ